MYTHVCVWGGDERTLNQGRIVNCVSGVMVRACTCMSVPPSARIRLGESTFVHVHVCSVLYNNYRFM